jgi:hypothetical protein
VDKEAASVEVDALEIEWAPDKREKNKKAWKKSAPGGSFIVNGPYKRYAGREGKISCALNLY